MRRFFLTVIVLAVGTATAVVNAADLEQLFFSRDQEGGVPSYFDVTVGADGRVVYREALDDEFPVEFQAPAADVSRLFEISKRRETSASTRHLRSRAVSSATVAPLNNKSS